jgi:hypothetical protein
MKLFIINSKLSSIPSLVFLIFALLIFNSCEEDIETYYLTDEERSLALLYEKGDTFKLRDSNDKIHNYYINKIDSGIGQYDFLGIPQYKYEKFKIIFMNITENHFNGSIGCDKSDNIFDYGLEIELPNVYFNVKYRDKENYHYKLQQKEQIEIDGIIYTNVYIFNNATSETVEPTQKIYLNMEYGFLKLEDLEKDVVYTIVRK